MTSTPTKQPAPHTPLIGCAGWSVVSRDPVTFAGSGTQLERYAQHLGAVEINSSFYRPHRHSTYQKWAQSVGTEFRFSVKIPKSITHAQKLQGSHELLSAFVEESSGLGGKLGVYLLQLPPSLAFESERVESFLTTLRSLTEVPVVCEARHASWFAAEVLKVLADYGMSQVAADPAPVPAASKPAGQVHYYRLHGSPRKYYSSYDMPTLQALAQQIQSQDVPSWVIFDNTASEAGVQNALLLRELLT